ncbi:glutamate--cysteine ligase [Thalassotalea sp. LPB0316]|uniref:glutamate--cysteine ligase n=1 Tax=Thalassotalea sp. LPB0316 TaxID=2769490 RepID=UPI0018677402|nr:glutamate--cysteine ligase [Thalassotalea sp. LPB0316]QOL26883.1 glutamate--cysteine ligase [Thalassotalea sp. LPB0316]
MSVSIQDFAQALRNNQQLAELTKISRGIERETLRVLPRGELSYHPHYHALGSALTHDEITTDYAENLLEFITPVSQSPEQAVGQLADIQKFVLSEIDDELLWPLSMPCFVDDANKIPLANYGSSNIGTMKTVYRQGLKNRYGSMMQVIAGIHFNFSLPQSFWQILQTLENSQQSLQDYQSDKYFALLRNYKRYCWLIPYLYGSSPAICPSFLQGRKTTLPFEKSSSGYMYLPYATSLRMSDLGYTNNAQSSLYICYNSLSQYLTQVAKAMAVSSDEFEKIGIKKDGQYQQLNSNVLQIENELYSPIRPKRVAKSGEKPSHALAERGVEYIEVRALDVNPFSATGISIEQVRFLDIFLTFCALNHSPALDCDDQHQFEENMNDVVVRGRDPQLKLNDFGALKSVQAWGREIFTAMLPVAQLLDEAHGGDAYQQVLNAELAKIKDPSLTPSAKILAHVVNDGQSLTKTALAMAGDYKAQLLAQDYQYYSQDYFERAAIASHQAQKAIEDSDTVSFDDFLADYFSS